MKGYTKEKFKGTHFVVKVSSAPKSLKLVIGNILRRSQIGGAVGVKVQQKPLAR